MLPLLKGRLQARLAQSEADVRAAQALRHLCFRKAEGVDADAFDAHCQHILIEDQQDGGLICCFRLLPLASGQGINSSYCAQFYDLDALLAYPKSMLEMGRFCIHPLHQGPDILRIAWGALTRFVDETGVGMLFGCTSFAGVDPSPYHEAFAQLHTAHLAPRQWRPQIRAPEVVALGAQPLQDPKRALQTTPPLLRSYLALGGWVSDHAVIDRDLHTLHVFTGLEIAAIPAARARALRMIFG